MGRHKKDMDTVVEEVNDVTEETVVVEETVDKVVEAPVVVKKPMETLFTVVTSYKTRTLDGDKINHKFKGSGSTLAEALDVVGSEEDITDEFNRPMPKGINGNILITVRTSKGYEFSRNVAKQVAKEIFEGKNVALATKLLIA